MFSGAGWAYFRLRLSGAVSSLERVFQNGKEITFHPSLFADAFTHNRISYSPLPSHPDALYCVYRVPTPIVGWYLFGLGDQVTI